MAFTDVEMAILAQLAYKDIPQGISLYDAINNNRFAEYKKMFLERFNHK